MQEPASPLVAFYRGTGTDSAGRSLAQIRRQHHAWLEYTHDFIQWLFPLRTPSAAHPLAPTLDEATIREFRSDPRLQAELRESFVLMLDFYGFTLLEKEGHRVVARSKSWPRRSANWLTPSNHNYFRLTRILTSLRTLGLEREAEALFAALTEVFEEQRGVIGERPFAFWRAAMQEAGVKPPGTASMSSVEKFCRALWQKDAATIAALIGRVDPNGQDRWGYTPLLMAVQYADAEIVAGLLDRGAEVDQGRRVLTPLTLATRRGARDIIRLLKQRGAKASLLTRIYEGDRPRVARALANQPAQACARDEEGTPFIHHAVEALQPELVDLLLRSGASVTDRDANGETPLHRCADLRQAPAEAAAAMTALLIDRGAEVDARNWDEVTPLHQAVRARNLIVVEVLLRRGADPNARDKSRGSTPLRRAVSATGAGGTAGTAALMVPLTRLLLEHGADPNQRDKRGVPVHASARAPAVRAVLEEFRRAGKVRS